MQYSRRYTHMASLVLLNQIKNDAGKVVVDEEDVGDEIAVLPSFHAIPYACLYKICAFVGDICEIFNSIALISKYYYDQFLTETFQVNVSNMNSGMRIDNFFQFLQKLRSLQTLQLHKVKLQSSHLASLEDSDYSLSKLKCLELYSIESEINLWNCCFAGELALEKLVIHDSKVTYIGALLSHTPHLKVLCISNILDFGNSSINQLEPILFNLRHLKLQNLPITDLALSYILKLIQQKNDSFKKNKDGSISNKAIILMKLERLEILCKNITNSIFKMLIDCHEYMMMNLKAINVSNCNIIKSADMYEFFSKYNTSINEVGLGCPKMDDNAFLLGMTMDDDKTMIRNMNLRKLLLAQSSISGKSLRLISSVFSHTLYHLNISWCNSIHGKDFEFLCEIKSLQELICNHCRRLHSNDVIKILLKCNKMHYLSCKNCSLVRLKDIEKKVPSDIRDNVLIKCGV